MTRFPFLAREPVRALLAALDTAGEEARVVGGAVRNALLGEDPGDIDIATTALPETVMARANAMGWRSIPTGIAHGTVMVVVAGEPYEVTTLREDIATNGRHAVVRFGRDFVADALRRDFTMNALGVAPDGTLHDVTGGEADARARRVRFIGDAAARIREDYLRILRFFRFQARYGAGPPDEAALEACAAQADGLGRLSRERVRAELLKLLEAPRAIEALDAMAAIGLMPHLIGGPGDIRAMERLTRASNPPSPIDPLLCLAVLAVHDGSDVARLAERLRLTNAETARLAVIASAGLDARDIDGPAAKRLAFRLGKPRAADVLHYRAARAGEDPTAALDAIAGWQVPSLPWRGADFAAAGLTGPAIGRAQKAAENAFVARGFPTDPAALRSIFDDAVTEA